MKKFKVARVLSLLMAVVISVTAFTIDSSAASAVETHKRTLTVEELTALSTIFNAKEYAAYYPDVEQALGTDEKILFSHFVNFGIWEQRQPSVSFNVDVYASRNADLQKLYGDDIVAYYVHYANNKKTEAWRPLPVPTDALWHNCIIYSVYDFVKGQAGPKAGAVPVMTPNYHPGVTVK